MTTTFAPGGAASGNFPATAQDTRSIALYFKTLLTGGRPTLVNIPALDGTATIAHDYKGIFGLVDPELWHYPTNAGNVQPTPATQLVVGQQALDGRFAEVIGGLSDLDRLSCSQGQILVFCRTHAHLLHPEWATFFLFRSTGKFFVAAVDVRRGEWHAGVYPVDSPIVWKGERLYRWVVPTRPLPPATAQLAS